MAALSNPGDIREFSISSNTKNFSIDISPSISEFRYYESVLSNTITATAVVIDAGVTGNVGKEGGVGTLIDYLPLRGGERADVHIVDNYGNEIIYELYVNRVRNSSPGTQQELFIIDFCSKEYFTNEKFRLTRRYKNAPISEHISAIAGEMGIEFIDVDDTSYSYNFFGNDRKPFYIMTWLASKAIPSSAGGVSGIGGAAGYLFYQTLDQFYFKSIDNLLRQSSNKKYIYNNTIRLPDGYDGKILKYNINADIDIQQNLSLGVYHNRTIVFDPLSFSYEVKDFGVDNQTIDSAGPIRTNTLINPDLVNTPTRFMTAVADVGFNMSGEGDEQIENTRDDTDRESIKNDNVDDNLVQSIMRYNQLFTIQTEITIPGDYSIRAGQMINCTFPEISRDKEQEINSETSGDYLVAHVCHRSTPKDTFTSLTLVRDSFGEREE